MAEQTLMNPYWFVPVNAESGAPRLTLEAWGVYDPATRCRPRPGATLRTGRIRLRLRTLTPLHVCGAVEAPPSGAMQRRHHYRRRHRDGTLRPVVEGSSIRGALRAYIEALTNGMASSFTTGFEHGSGDPRQGRYAKRRGDRHIGFWVGRAPVDGDGKPEPGAAPDRIKAWHARLRTPSGNPHVFGDRDRRHVVNRPAHLFPPSSFGDRVGTDLAPAEDGANPVAVDAATLMFGHATLDADSDAGETAGASQGPRPVHAIAGRLRFQDAFFAERGAVKDYESLDLDAPAALGGAKPVKSSWWYFKPGEIRRRVVRGRGRTFEVAEFVGAGLRGRKQYFHQDPVACAKWYLDNWGPRLGRLLRPVPTECVDAGQRSEPFDIVFEDLPECLLRLLIVALNPSCAVRHKLGGLKPFGFGSVAFEVEAVLLEKPGPAGLEMGSGPDDGLARDPELERLANCTGWCPAGHADRAKWNEEQQAREYDLCDPEGNYLVDDKSWPRIRLIGCCPDPVRASSHRLFVYPPFGQGRGLSPLQRGFAMPVQTDSVDRDGLHRPIRDAREQQQVLRRLWKGTKRAIDLDFYQLRASNYPALKREVGL